MYRERGHNHKHISWRAQAKYLGIMLALVVFSSLAVALYFSYETGSAAEDVLHFDEVQVNPGDTLWTLAGPYRPAGMDIRDYVDIVAEINGVEDGIIQPGQRITMPR